MDRAAEPSRSRSGKKLIALGRAWARGGRGRDIEDSSAAWGITPDPHQLQAGTVELWPEHVEAYDVFSLCGTQWRFIGGGMMGPIRQGLDYGALESVMRMRKVAEPGECLAQIRHIERGALEVFNQ